LELEEEIAFYGIIPNGNILKCISELLMRCSSNIPVTSDATGIMFLACDATSGRLIHIVMKKEDMLAYKFHRLSVHTSRHPQEVGINQGNILRCSLDSHSLHAVFHQRSLSSLDEANELTNSKDEFGLPTLDASRARH
jgi:hypothetical protein